MSMDVDENGRRVWRLEGELTTFQGRDAREITSWNALVRQHAAVIDWTGLQEASEQALRTVLSGLTLEHDDDVLGIGSVPESLSQVIGDILRDNASQATVAQSSRRRTRKPAGHAAPAPAVWTAPERPPRPDPPQDDLIPLDDLGDEDDDDAGETPSVPGGETLAAGRKTAVELRDELAQMVMSDLLGPAGGPEEIVTEDSVRERYIVGMLAPKRATRQRGSDRHDGAADDDFAVAGSNSEEGSVEPEPSGPDWLFPSSFGLSFMVDGDISVVKVTASWGRYELVHAIAEEPHEPEAAPSAEEVGRLEPLEPATSEVSGAGPSVVSTDRPERRWLRTPITVTIPSMRLTEGAIGPHVVDSGVVVQGKARRRGHDWMVSLFLVNEQEVPARSSRGQDSFWLFQPELRVEGVNGGADLVRRPLRITPGLLDPLTELEDRTMAMLYRRHQEFAVGHGVGVHATPVPGQPHRATSIVTRVIPSYEVPRTDAPSADELPELRGLTLDMKLLADLPDGDLAASLAPLSAGYATWIARQAARLGGGADGLHEHQMSGDQALALCRRAQERIAEGIALLAANPQAADAFRFMNRAMWLQRTHGLHAEAVRRANPDARVSGGTAASVPTWETFDLAENRTWRPFQLAFILQSLPGLTDLGHQDRVGGSQATADLLWFPTGGGKTEAYLGLSSYTLAIRRLQGVVAGHSGEAGVAVIMRYTLRLLTLQQFQRATALVCACEVIRREALERGDDRWGREPFRIGLWVGQRMTPNSTEASYQAALQLRATSQGAAHVAGGSPAQLTACPWCGKRLDAGRDLEVHRFGDGAARTYTFCSDTLGICPFSRRQAPSEGLPVIVVDEEIYRRLPSMLIATVDKFAQLPWEGETQMLFGRVNSRCDRHGFRSPEIEDADTHPARRQRGLPPARTAPCLPLRPPDLIIQDELHLISGPLGTLVGLYETAIDELAAWDVHGQRVRPKVIASTATVRRARDQVQALFVRRLDIFPPSGLDVEDNFFSRQQPPGRETPGRRYLGICAPGRRQKAVLIRVYLAYLAAAQKLFDEYGRRADPWMTLVGYFNTLRELGGMRRLVDDDVASRLNKADKRGLAKRRLRIVEELTSRMGSIRIPVVLDQLEAPFDPDMEAQRRARRREGGQSGTPPPIDVLLATNMVSVGVDVRRLGLMIVAGQPKTTAEYIQATSRVGRAAPGLVCTVLNWARPRDLSHYERFEHYHTTFYQQVEALSVTPFAPRAVDRGLSAVLVALVRLAANDLNPNRAASQFTRATPLFEAAKRAISWRAHQVSSRADVRDSVETRIDVLADAWANNATNRTGGRELHYQRQRGGGVAVPLLETPGVERWRDFTCLRSLRDVEPASALVVVGVDNDLGLDDDPPRRGTGQSPAVDSPEAAQDATEAVS